MDSVVSYPEKILFGCCFLDNEVINTAIVNGITEDSFTWYGYKRTWKAIRDIYLAGKVVDFTSFGAVIDDERIVKEVTDYLRWIINPKTDAINAISLIRTKYLREHGRGILVDTYTKIRINEPDVIIKEGIAKLEKLIHVNKSGKDENAIQDIMDNLNNANIIDTGYPRLNWMTKGIEPSAMWVIGGSSSHGKTNFVLNISYHVSQKHPVTLFSSEMSKKQLLKRLASMYIGLNPSLRDLSEEEKKDFLVGLKRADELPIHFLKTVSLAEIKMEVRKQESILYIVDFLQMIRPDLPIENDVKRLGYVIRELETLTKDYDTCVICTSQFNRPIDRTARLVSPSLDRYRGSGEIEENTDIGILMHYPWQSATPEEREKIESTNRSNIISITVQKNRLHGLTGTFKVHFDKDWMKMHQISEE